MILFSCLKTTIDILLFLELNPHTLALITSPKMICPLLKLPVSLLTFFPSHFILYTYWTFFNSSNSTSELPSICYLILLRTNFFLDIISSRNLLWPVNSELSTLPLCSCCTIYSFITALMKWHYTCLLNWHTPHQIVNSLKVRMYPLSSLLYIWNLA